MTLDAVLFDLDDTLLFSRDLSLTISKTAEFVCHQQPGVTVADIVSANQSAWSQHGLTQMDNWMLGRLSGFDMTFALWRATLTACGIHNETLIAAARDYHSALAREDFTLFADVMPVLDALSAAGIAVGLVTNGAVDTQTEKLAATGLDARFDGICISGDLGVAKPDKRAFLAALPNGIAASKNVVHVGDNLTTDVGGANDAGLRSVWINRHNKLRLPGEPEPDLATNDLRELLKWV